MNWRKIFLPILFSLAILLGVFLGARLSFSNKHETYRPTHQKLYRLLDILDREYLKGVNTDSIVDLTVQSILNTLDPHSTYVSANDYSQRAEVLHGSFHGIGIRFYTYKDTIAITEVLPKSPAEKAGLKNGDRILSANGQRLFGKSISQDSVVHLLRGVPNTELQLEAYRKREKKQWLLNVLPKRVPIQSVTAAYTLLDEDLVYLKIEQFTEDTYVEFQEALNRYSKQNNASLVLDLRNNSGGYVEQAKQIMEAIIPKGTLLYSTKDRTGKEKKFYAKKAKKHSFSRVYVLLNEQSASASEMIAGAIQDNDLGTIIGRRSFGKGLVQVERPLGDGSAVWITVAQYYTPTGRSIQRSYTDGNKAYFAHADPRYMDRKQEDIDNLPDSLRFETPKGKIVYGGGGIYPDIYVPDLDTKQDHFIQRILRHGFVQFFAFEYIDAHPDLFMGYEKEHFIEGYEVTDNLLMQFMEYSHLDMVGVQWEAYQEELLLMIKANLALQLYGKSAYYRVLSEQDEIIQKAIQIEQISR